MEWYWWMEIATLAASALALSLLQRRLREAEGDARNQSRLVDFYKADPALVAARATADLESGRERQRVEAEILSRGACLSCKGRGVVWEGDQGRGMIPVRKVCAGCNGTGWARRPTMAAAGVWDEYAAGKSSAELAKHETVYSGVDAAPLEEGCYTVRRLPAARTEAK